MARPTTPWEEARAAHPDTMLVRLIFVDKGLQFFLRLNPTDARRAEAAVWDGATVISPSAPGARTPEDIDRIVAEFDAAWREAQA
jgi:hypothetical protein